MTEFIDEKELEEIGKEAMESADRRTSPPATKADIEALRSAIIGKIDEAKTEISARTKVPFWHSFHDDGKPRVSYRRLAIIVAGGLAMIITWIQTGQAPSFGAFSQIASTAGVSLPAVIAFRGRMAEDRKRLENEGAPLVDPAMLEAVVGWLEQRMASAPDNGARHE